MRSEAGSPWKSCWKAFSRRALVSAAEWPCSAKRSRYFPVLKAPLPSPGMRLTSGGGALTCGGGGAKPVWACRVSEVNAGREDGSRGLRREDVAEVGGRRSRPFVPVG